MPFTHVLTVYDGTPESEDLLDMVCRIVRPHHARLTILIVKVVPLTEPLPDYEAGADAEMDDLVSRAEKFADKRKVKAASAVRYARALGAAVVAEVRTRGVDLVALLAPDIETLLSDREAGADTDFVLRKATCAVMLCRPQPAGL
jgi:nucleotide-binding universal stress UspA family protein